MPRVLKAALLGPIIYAALLTIIISIRFYAEITSHGEIGIQTVQLIIAGALLLLNLHVFLIGWPLYTYLKRKNKARLRNLLACGFTACAITSLIISAYIRIPTYEHIAIQTLVYGLSGMIVTWLIWLIGIREPKNPSQ